MYTIQYDDWKYTPNISVILTMLFKFVNAKQLYLNYVNKFGI